MAETDYLDKLLEDLSTDDISELKVSRPSHSIFFLYFFVKNI